MNRRSVFVKVCLTKFDKNDQNVRLPLHPNINNIYSKSNYWTIGESFATGYYTVMWRLVD